MTTPSPKPRWFHLTPDRLVLLLLVVEGLLWLSDRLGWPEWHKGYAVLAAIASVGVWLLLMLLWFVAALIFRLRFQFSIRSLLVLTVAVAQPFSWLSWEMRKAREQREAVKGIWNLGGLVFYDYPVDALGNGLLTAEPPGPVWLRELLGAEFFIGVAYVGFNGRQVTDAGLEHLQGLPTLQGLVLAGTQITDAGLQHVKGLAQLRTLSLGGTGVTDAGLKHLEGLTQLGRLDLSRTLLTDAGLEHLKGLAQLRTLSLGGTEVTDAGLEHLKGLNGLQELRLGSTQVTDAGLEHLKGLAKLRWLNLNSTPVTDEGVKNLRQALPNCQIIH